MDLIECLYTVAVSEKLEEIENLLLLINVGENMSKQLDSDFNIKSNQASFIMNELITSRDYGLKLFDITSLATYFSREVFTLVLTSKVYNKTLNGADLPPMRYNGKDYTELTGIRVFRPLYVSSEEKLVYGLIW